MKTTLRIAPEQNVALSELAAEELNDIVGGSIDLDVPQCGTGWPRWQFLPNPASLVVQPAGLQAHA